MSLPIGNLNIDLSSVDTSFPSTASGDHRCRIKKVDFEESKNKPGMWFFLVTGETLEATQDTKGNVLPAGWTLVGRMTIPGAPGEDDSQKKLRETQIASFIDAAVGNSEKGARPKFDEEFVNQLPNKELIFVVGKKKAEEDGSYPYGETEVKRFKALAQ